MRPIILKKDPLSLNEVSELLVELEKSGELSPNQQKIRDFTSKFNNLNKEKTLNLIKELEASDIPRLTLDTIIEIINMMPQNETELKTVLVRNRLTISKENSDKILSILKSK
jgi:DNA-directed RNA polymerase subunit F